MNDDTKRARYDAKRKLRQMIETREKCSALTQYEAQAINLALQAMITRGIDTQDTRVLSYHVNNPTACLFRDYYTMRALRAGYDALCSLPS